MSKWESLNLDLRSVILGHSLRLEQTSSDIIKAILRILKKKTRTLGNKSSSLSFKNKIDLLHDLDELTELEYSHLIKFMEIRNQFMHNHEFNSFLKLKEIYPEYTNYLIKNFPNEESDDEKKIYESYKKLYIACQGKLLLLENEYVQGIKEDYERFVSLQIDRRFDELIDKAKNSMIKANERLPFSPFFFGTSYSNIDSFILAIKIEKATMSSEILDVLDSEGSYRLAFQRKASNIDEQIKEIEDESN